MPASATRSRTTLVVLGGVVLVVVATAAVWWAGHQAVTRTSVSAGDPQCQGTEPRPVRVPRTGLEQMRVPMREGFECTVQLSVVNDGDRTVTLDHVTVPVGGAQGGAAFRVTHLDGTPIPDDSNVDAVVDLGSSLAPGTSQLLELRVAFRSSGCTSLGGTMWVMPVVEVSDLLAHHAESSADALVFLGTADSSCDS